MAATAACCSLSPRHPENSVLHNNVLNDALNIDVRVFVADVVDSAIEWHGLAEKTTEYAANYPRFMQRYAEGLLPYIGGVPVIA